jgi:hypothetical protein
MKFLIILNQVYLGSIIIIMIRLIKLICCCCKKNSNGKRKVTNSVNKDQSLEYIPNSEGFRNNLINPSDDDYNSFESNKKSNKSMIL